MSQGHTITRTNVLLLILSFYLNWAQFISIVFLVWISKLILELQLIQIINRPGMCPKIIAISIRLVMH